MILVRTSHARFRPARAACLLAAAATLMAQTPVQNPYSDPRGLNTVTPDPSAVDTNHTVLDRMSRVQMVKDDATGFQDQITQGNTRAYGFRVPPKGTLVVKLEHPKESYFRLDMSTPGGAILPGMRFNMVRAQLQNVRFENTEKKDVDVVVLVQGPSRTSSDAQVYDTPFQIIIKRSQK